MFFVFGQCLLIGRVGAQQWRALGDFPEDKILPVFLAGRFAGHLIGHRSGNYHHPFGISNDNIAGINRHAAATEASKLLESLSHTQP